MNSVASPSLLTTARKPARSMMKVTIPLFGSRAAAKSNPSAAIGPRSPALTFVCPWSLSPV